MKALTLVALLHGLIVTQIYAQGILSGTITDGDFGETLIGANVVIHGNTIGTSTDFDGKYQFEVEQGIYTVIVSYLGFADKRVENVEIKPGEITYLDVTMSSEGVDLGVEVVVEAKAIERSENSVLLLQRKSDKILDGISAQEMSRYAVGSAAAAMKKVTGATVSGGKYIYIRGLGDRYSLSQLNGLVIPSTDPYRNGAQLDLIPANLLDNIITSKTFTPDLPGTFTGGNVDIKTKSFPEQFSLSISTSVGYNNQNNLVDDFLSYDGGGSDYWGFDDGTRRRPSFYDTEVAKAVFGFGTNQPRIARRESFYNAFIGDNNTAFDSQQDYAYRVDEVAKALSREFVPIEKTSSLNHGFSLAYGDQVELLGRALGVILSTSFKTQYNNLPAYQKANWRLEFSADDDLFNQGNFEETLSTQSPTLNAMVGLAYKLDKYNFITFNSIYNHAADKTSRYILGERPDNIVFPRSLQGRSLVFQERELINFQLGGNHVLATLNKAIIEWRVSRASSSLYEPDTRFFENDIDTSGRSSIPASDVQRPFHFFRDLDDEQNDYKLDFTLPLGSSLETKLKFGGLYTQKDRDFIEYRYQIEEHLGFAQPYNGDPDDYLADDNYGLIDSDIDNSSYIIGNYLVDRSQLKNNYEGYEKVTAAYSMISFKPFQRLKILTGVRFEKTDIKVESADSFAVEEDRIGKINENDLLPAVNLNYSLTDQMNVRAAYSQTVARPNMREIAPFEAFDPLTKETYFGNTDLKRTTIQNFDLRWEWFFNPGEMISVSGYYKDFDDPIIQAYRQAPNPEIEFTNVKSAFVYGLEFELRKSLSFVSPLLRDLRLSTNLSLIESESDVATQIAGLDPESRPFEGQAPFIWNASLIYSSVDNGWDATLSLNSIGDRLRIIGREGTPDIYNRGRTQLDISVIKKLGDVNIKLSATNLTNSEYVVSSEYKGEEYVYSKYKTGVTYNFGLSYTIK